MDDARYVLFQDLKEKNAAKNGAFKKVRGGGRHVRMPSDTLTRKEWKAMNGEVKTYRMGEPMGWKEFLKLPEDYQRAYIAGLDAKYDPTNGQLAWMFGVSSVTVGRWRAEHEVPRPSKKLHPSAEKVQAWTEWVAGKAAEKDAPEEETKDEDASPCDVMGTDEAVPTNDPVETLTALLRGLAGSGAKITIEVVL